jgi:hypothetical protein
MTRGLLLLAAGLLIAPAALAMDAPIQPGGGNNVSAQFKTAPAPAPAPAPATPDIYHAQAPAPSFDPAAYRTTTECLNAASAAHQMLGQCEGRGR